jgi:hypothetical protein
MLVRQTAIPFGSSSLSVLRLGRGFWWEIELKRDGKFEILRQEGVCASCAAALRDGLNRQDLLAATD